MGLFYSIVAGIAALSYIAVVCFGYKYLKEDYNVNKNLFYMAEAMSMNEKAF